MSSDHTETATITPEAKPSNDFCTKGGIKERMHAPRTGYRKAQDAYMRSLEAENLQLKTENLQLKAEIESLKKRLLGG